MSISTALIHMKRSPVIMRMTAYAAVSVILALCSIPAAAQDSLQAVDPVDAGFSPEKLDSLRAFVEAGPTSSMVILHNGRIVFQSGDIHRKHVVHSIRKSLLNSIFGIYVDRGVIDTTATLEELGVDDIHPLSSNEKQATVADLLRSRSGVYHAAAAESEGMARARPERGSAGRGESYYYNNWDFNVLGTIFEQQTGVGIFDAFRGEIARPLGMTEFEGTVATIEEDATGPPDADAFYQFERSRSRHPAYHFRLSAYDLALYGQLYLNRGRRGDRQIVPESWVDASTRVYSITNPKVGIGYGMLWSVLIPDDPQARASFFHTGAGVHMLAVYPRAGLVFVHRVDTEAGVDFPQERLYRIISMIFDAREE